MARGLAYLERINGPGGAFARLFAPEIVALTSPLLRRPPLGHHQRPFHRCRSPRTFSSYSGGGVVEGAQASGPIAANFSTAWAKYSRIPIGKSLVLAK